MKVIPMDTDFASWFADLFPYSYKTEYINSLSEFKETNVTKR